MGRNIQAETAEMGWLEDAEQTGPMEIRRRLVGQRSPLFGEGRPLGEDRYQRLRARQQFTGGGFLA